MAATGTYLASKTLDHNLNTTPLPQTPLFLHLYTSNPTANDTGIEVSGAGYAPVAAPFSPAVAGVASNSGSIVFAEAASLWGLISHFGLKDNLDNLYYFGQFAVAKTIDTGDVAAIAAGDLSVSQT
jgi:hypothetical protein